MELTDKSCSQFPIDHWRVLASPDRAEPSDSITIIDTDQGFRQHS